jgi:hypothetical protein
MIEKVNREEKTSSKISLTEDEYIDVNLKKIYADNGGKIAFVTRNNRHGNANTLSELTELFQQHNLAEVKATRSILTSFGEEVCKVGGWIKYLELQTKINQEKKEKIKEIEDLEIELAKSNIEANRLNAKIAKQNRKDNRFNRAFLIINAVFAAINILIAILQ